MTTERKKRILAAVVWALRLIVGAVFTISGVAKMIDPYGFIYKINDYLAVWGMDVGDGPVIFAAVLLSATEFLTGFTLATGSMRRLSVWIAMAMMAFMLPLTLYVAVADPVDDCGCFGDFIIISNWATFWKNVAITAALCFLIRRNRNVEGLFTPMSQWLQITLAAAWLIYIGLVGYNEQPLVDFRPYPVGQPLLREADTESIIYRYQAADGTIADFTADMLPDGDDGWTFLERIDPEAGIHESAFAVFDADGNDVTYDVIGAVDRQLLMLVPDVAAAGISGTYTANELARVIAAPDDPEDSEAFVAIVHAADSAVLSEWIDMSMIDYPVYYAEDTAIKTVARGKMALVYLEDDTVRWKRDISSVNPEVVEFPDFTFESLATDGPADFRHTLALLVIAEVIVLLLGRGATFSRLKILRARRRAH